MELRDYGQTPRQWEIKPGCMSPVEALNLNQFSKFKVYKREHKFVMYIFGFKEEIKTWAFFNLQL